jgi:hypothetical protein
MTSNYGFIRSPQLFVLLRKCGNIRIEYNVVSKICLTRYIYSEGIKKHLTSWLDFYMTKLLLVEIKKVESSTITIG